MSMVKVSALPTKPQWVEGVDYTVIAGIPQPGDNVRVRDISGESFNVYTPITADPQPPPPIPLSKTAFQDYAVSQLGTGLAGMARFQAVMDATAAGSGAIKFCFSRYQAADTFAKPQVANFTAIMVGASIMTGDERAAILTNWPTS